MEKKSYVVDVSAYIYVEAESEEEAQELVLDTLNTAYEQGKENAYFCSIELEVGEDDCSSHLWK